jgi:hypothetical protein
LKSDIERLNENMREQFAICESRERVDYGDAHYFAMPKDPRGQQLM